MRKYKRLKQYLQKCNRIRISYPRDNLIYVISDIRYQNVLSIEEYNYIQSTKYFEITDEKNISEFIKIISKGKYSGKGQDPVGYLYSYPVCYTCLNDYKKLISFTTIVDIIITDDGYEFSYKKELDLQFIYPTELQPFKLRGACAEKIYLLFYYLKIKDSFPNSNNWGDSLLCASESKFQKSDEDMSEVFKCPSAKEGKCHYAMNPNCNSGSPADMVFLFETRDGWNQQGGPELFTFDNHDPKGGCVLLNDRTIKFIRTEEELKNLRWK